MLNIGVIKLNIRTIMKKITLLFTGVLLAALCSCSLSNEPKEISPTSTDFTSGELAKLIEVVDEPCQLSYVEQDGAIATQFIKLKVKLRLTKESPKLKEVDARDINFVKLLSVATINLVDENETKIQDLDVKSEDLLKLKKLLQGNEGDEETITFEGEFHNSDDAPKWFEQATAFTPYLTADVIVGNGVDTSTSSSFDIEGCHDLSGIVDKYPITMHLEIDGSTVKGSYYYNKQGVNSKLKLQGSNENGVLDINETDAEGTPTGHFSGKFSNGVYKGQFVTNQGKKMSFVVSENGEGNSDLNSEDASFDELESSFDNEGDESVDEFLDEYEKFWRTYINYMKKLDQNNPTAMIEYAKLLQQYNSYNMKLQKIRGHMSVDQLNRINQMNLELMQEMDKIKQ